MLGPHSLASFTTEWRAYPMTTWGATAKGPTTVRAEALGYTKEMAGFEGDRRMERVNPELTDGAYYGPSRGHLQPRWAQHVGMPRGYGYGASMGAWVLDYVAAWAGEWGSITHSTRAVPQPRLHRRRHLPHRRGRRQARRAQAQAPRHREGGAAQPGRRRDVQGHRRRRAPERLGASAGDGGRAADEVRRLPRRRARRHASRSSRASGCRSAQALDGIQADFGVSDTALGWLGAAMVLVGVAGSFPFGALADRWRRVALMVIAMVVWTACMGLNAIAPTFAFLFVSRHGRSGSSRPTARPAVSLMADYYPVANRARMMGRYQLGAAVGGLLGVALAGVLVDTYGWRAAFWMWVPVRASSWSCSSAACREPERGAQDRAFHQEEIDRIEADGVAGPAARPPPPGTSRPARSTGADATLGRRHPRAAPHPLDVVRADVAHDLAVLLGALGVLGHRVLQAGLRPHRHQGRRLRTGHRSRRGARARRRRRGGRPPPAPRRRRTRACT